MSNSFDTSFDVRTDAKGRDPDTYSPTLRDYHQRLWSKRLPGGQMFDLDASEAGRYLSHRSSLGEFVLTSDSVIPTFTTWKRLAHIIDPIPKPEVERFRALAYTVGGMMVFPGHTVDGKQTINAARGRHPRISDRMDLTLESIRRFYSGSTSPLEETLDRYSEYFALFRDFRGYTDFFLLQDLVTPDYAAVRFLMPFEGFSSPSRPDSAESYAKYRALTVDFINARNDRMARYIENAGV